MNGALRPVEVVFVGQIPPPYHGQAVMMAALLEGTYCAIRLHHVPLAFSRVTVSYTHLTLPTIYSV